MTTPTGDKRPLSWLWILPAFVVLIAAALTQRSPLAPWLLGDVTDYHRDALLLTHGLMPYRDFPLEYPPLSLAAFLLPLALSLGRGAVSVSDYAWVFAAGNAVLSSVLGLALSRMEKEPPPSLPLRKGEGRGGASLAWYALFVLLLSPLIPWRFDLFPALLTLLALRSTLSGRPGAAGLWLGMGIAAKLYPLVLVPVFLAYYITQGDKRACGRLLLGTLAASAACALPFLAAGPQMLSFVQYHQRRGIEIGSVPGGVLLLAHDLGHLPVGWVFNYGAFHLVSPWAASILSMMPVAALVIGGGVLALCVRRFRDDRARWGAVRPESLVTFLAAMLLAFVFTNKVFSPQYLIWLLPFAPLLRPRAGLAFAALCVLTVVVFPWGFSDLLAGRLWVVAVLNGRNLLVLALLVALVRERVAPRPSFARPFLPTIGADPALTGTAGE